MKIHECDEEWNCMSPHGVWPNSVSELPNPITRTVVRLNPPVHIENDAQFDYFQAQFKAYCVAAWNLARMDPRHIDAPYNWVLPRENRPIYVEPDRD